ncbi:MAG TPA: ChbG/HpnK family deacetylase [Methylomirabilota bacterium]
MGLTRRLFLRSGLAAAGGWLAAPSAPASATPSPEDPYTAASSGGAEVNQRLAIVNADDLGMSAEIDRGIFEGFDRGIVTSASLLVDSPHAHEAVHQVRRRADVSLGLHVAFDQRGRWLVNMQDPRAVQRELDRQLEAFVRLTGGPPTHIDSHHHAHRLFNVAWQFLEAGARYHCPVRGFSEVFFVGRFWGQPEFGRTDVTKISAESLASIFKALGPGVSEISCHPGRMESRPDAWYNREREVELQSLCDAKVKAAIAAEGIRLISFREYRHVASTTARHMLASGCRPTASSH